MNTCIFCKIIAGDEPASIVYEDDDFIALMDAYPLTKGHCLVIPKLHLIRLDDLKAKQRARLFHIGHKIVEAQKQIGLGIEGTNILVNDGKAANQTVPHLHLHLIPRASGDLLKSIPKLILHITGIFGLKTPIKTLEEQAIEIAKHL
jgi:histidine triad (HIT) family protein